MIILIGGLTITENDMEACELMIGDLVSVTAKFFYIDEDSKSERLKWKIETRICRVEELGKDKIRVDAAVYEYISIEPIPLTPKMLETNGWIFDETSCSWDIFNFPYIYEDNGGYCNYYDGHEIRLDYVHQLQHSLHLCGLNDLVNNFKA